MAVVVTLEDYPVELSQWLPSADSGHSRADDQTTQTGEGGDDQEADIRAGFLRTLSGCSSGADAAHHAGRCGRENLHTVA